MTSVVLRYATPLAAFGHGGRFNDRPTAVDPTISALQGMVAAAAGIGRTHTLPHWIAELHLAIRLDREGRVVRDYHTIGEPDMRAYRWMDGERAVNRKGHVSYTGDLRQVSGTAQADTDARGRPMPSRNTVLSKRWYVADASYLVALHDATGNIAAALDAPVWALYAGRKACPLTAPFLLGTAAAAPEQAIQEVPTVAAGADDPSATNLTRRAVLLTSDSRATRHEDRNDRMLGFRRHRRQRRWHLNIDGVPVVHDWFAVIDHLAD